LSATFRVAEKVPAAAAVNVTATVQLAPAERLVPQVLVWAKFVGLLPAIVTLATARTAFPVLFNCTVWGAEVTPLSNVNVRAAGVMATMGAGLRVKLAVTVCGALRVTFVVGLELLATAPVQLTNV
jgi:hypothetical protein